MVVGLMSFEDLVVDVITNDKSRFTANAGHCQQFRPAKEGCLFKPFEDRDEEYKELDLLQEMPLLARVLGHCTSPS